MNTAFIFSSNPKAKAEISLDFRWENQGDVNFGVDLQKYIIPWLVSSIRNILDEVFKHGRQ